MSYVKKVLPIILSKMQLISLKKQNSMVAAKFGEKNLKNRQLHVKNGQNKQNFYKAEDSALM